MLIWLGLLLGRIIFQTILSVPKAPPHAALLVSVYQYHDFKRRDIAGLWMRLSETIDYALEIKPNTCFPVHDSILKQPGSTHRIPPQVLEPKGIKFVVLEIDKEYEF